MRFKSFEINNFKGVRHAKLDLVPAGSNIFTLIGLNESGKTTLLEAIDDFGSSAEGIEALYGAERHGEYASYVPKQHKANFTGEISVKATIECTEEDKASIVAAVMHETGCRLEVDSIPSEFSITRGYDFVDSDYKKKLHNWSFSPIGKKKRERVARNVSLRGDVGRVFVAEVQKKIPKIVYFPTFLFAIPEKIYLNEDPASESDVNRHYRQILQDVASSLTSPLDIQTHIVDRIVGERSLADKVVAIWSLGADKQRQVNATLNQISSHLTKTVFESWSKIFSGDFRGREIVLRLGVDEGENGQLVNLSFVLKDGVTEYDVSERSLGFRWFFSFLLFTLYRVFAKGRGTTLFLLDEPASNLHARAQMQLLDSFARIADGDNQILYSTHSHYMINPEWLDGAFVVANRAIDYENELSDNRQTDVEVDRYRHFVGANPGKTTYFQPVLDKLDVVPSRLDLLRPSVLVEGKGDFFALEYGRRVLLESQSHVAVVPTRGAAGMDEMIGLLLGWGVDFGICVDGDSAGLRAQKKYISEWGLPRRSVITLADLDEQLAGCRIEDLISADDVALIGRLLGCSERPTKSQIQLFFSEALARREKHPFSNTFRRRVAAFEDAVAGMFPDLVGPPVARSRTKRR